MTEIPERFNAAAFFVDRNAAEGWGQAFWLYPSGSTGR